MLVICDARYECGNGTCVWKMPNESSGEMLGAHCGTVGRYVNVQLVEKDTLANMDDDNPNKIFIRRKNGF